MRHQWCQVRILQSLKNGVKPWNLELVWKHFPWLCFRWSFIVILDTQFSLLKHFLVGNQRNVFRELCTSFKGSFENRALLSSRYRSQPAPFSSPASGCCCLFLRLSAFLMSFEFSWNSPGATYTAWGQGIAVALPSSPGAKCFPDSVDCSCGVPASRIARIFFLLDARIFY